MNYLKNNIVYDRILHTMAGIALGYLLFSCKSSKSNCDAYSSYKTEQVLNKDHGRSTTKYKQLTATSLK